MKRHLAVLGWVVAFVSAALSAPSADAQVFSRNWGSPGSGDGQFANPLGIAVDDGEVFVTVNRRIQVYDLKENFLRKWGSPDSGDPFFFPIGIAVDDGEVFVADTGNHRIQVFTIDWRPSQR